MIEQIQNDRQMLISQVPGMNNNVNTVNMSDSMADIVDNYDAME